MDLVPRGLKQLAVRSISNSVALNSLLESKQLRMANVQGIDLLIPVSSGEKLIFICAGRGSLYAFAPSNTGVVNSIRRHRILLFALLHPILAFSTLFAISLT